MTPRPLQPLTFVVAALLVAGCTPPPGTPPTSTASPSFSSPSDGRPTDAAAVIAPRPATLTPANRLLVSTDFGLLTIDPDGKNPRRVPSIHSPDRDGRQATLSPNGTMVAYLSIPRTAVGSSGGYSTTGVIDTLHVRGVDDTAGLDFKLPDEAVREATDWRVDWSPDSSEALVSTCYWKNGKVAVEARVVDVAKKTFTTPATRLDDWPLAYSPDGTGFVVKRFVSPHGGEPYFLLEVVSRDGKTATPVDVDQDYDTAEAHISPDGQQLLFMGSRHGVPGSPCCLCVQPVGGKARQLVPVPEGAGLFEFCWSPDGKRVAYTWNGGPWPTQAEKEKRHVRVMVGNADGSGDPAAVKLAPIPGETLVSKGQVVGPDEQDVWLKGWR